MDASRKIPGSIHDEKLIIQFKYRVSRKLGTYHVGGFCFLQPQLRYQTTLNTVNVRLLF